MARKWETFEIIHDAEGNPYYLKEKSYLPEHQLTLHSGNKIDSESGKPINSLTKFILTEELRTFILNTLDQPCSALNPPFTRVTAQKLRRRALKSPYKTYQEWVKNDCRPERVHFLVHPEKDTPQTITDFHGQTHVVYSARRLKNGLPLFNGVLESKFHDKDQHVVPRDILTPHIAAVILDHPYSRAKVQETLDLPRNAMSNFKDLLNLNYFKDRQNFIALNIEHILDNDRTYKPPEVPDTFFNRLPRRYGKIIKNAIFEGDEAMLDWFEQCGRQPTHNPVHLKKIKDKINIKGMIPSSVVHMYFILKDAGKVDQWKQEVREMQSSEDTHERKV